MLAATFKYYFINETFILIILERFVKGGRLNKQQA